MRAPPRGLGVRGIVILAAIALLTVGWLYVSRSKHAPATASRSVLDVIPEGAFLVAVVDVAALRQTEVGQRFLGEGRNIAGLGDVNQVCGSDPMNAVTELAVAVPGASGIGFGLFATGNIEADAMLSCAERIVEKRGGRPVRQQRDGFAVLRDATLELSSAELAVADKGPLLLAEPDYVRASLEVAAERAPSTRDEPAHRALRKLVEPGLLVATVVLNEEQRKSLADELRAQQMSDSPFSSLTSGAMSVALGERLRMHVVLRCTSAEACTGVARLIDSARRDEMATFSARAVGLAAVLEQAAVSADGDAVHLKADIGVDEAIEVVRRALLLRRLSQLPQEQQGPKQELPPDAGERIEATGGGKP
ncbi:MAG TPA: hypothetical protein VFB62_10680 [Polyangiaceae bacterium]|jgi:hypothetical protein|nr:hypothetical protein [Polyangiaceae bacterium]